MKVAELYAKLLYPPGAAVTIEEQVIELLMLAALRGKGPLTFVELRRALHVPASRPAIQRFDRLVTRWVEIGAVRVSTRRCVGYWTPTLVRAYEQCTCYEVALDAIGAAP